MKKIVNTGATGNTVLVSTSGSAILGGSIFGFAGAIIGAVVGATLGLIASNEEDDNDTPKKRSSFKANVSAA